MIHHRKVTGAAARWLDLACEREVIKDHQCRAEVDDL
jgi:hypothetical protein